MAHASNHSIPVVNEGSQIISGKLDPQEILNRIERTEFLIGPEVLVEHEQHLTTPNCSTSIRLSLFELEDLPGQLTFSNLRQGCQQLSIQSEKWLVQSSMHRRTSSRAPGCKESGLDLALALYHSTYCSTSFSVPMFTRIWRRPPRP